MTQSKLSTVNRRSFLAGAAGTAAAAMVATARAQSPAKVSPNATPRDWSGNNPILYPDPDVVALDPRFKPYIIFNAGILRLYTGALWSEGAAWNGVGRYLVWSDIPNNVQLRLIEDDMRVTKFRQNCGFTNGNTFDYQGRELSCSNGRRSVLRYEWNGCTTVVAERFNGKRLNSPNDIVVHPDGGIWFTDPPYGIRTDYEGFRGESELPEAVYRVDASSGRVALVTDEVDGPNGLCFSPDYKQLYVANTGQRNIAVWDIAGARLRNRREHARLSVPDTDKPAAPDGIRCDEHGNIWAAARPGVQVIAPDGQCIGMIRLPELCANLAFGGQRRNRLFMTASASLYAVYVAVRGAHIC